MTKLTKHKNGNILLERNNTIINLVYKNKSVYLSKKDIGELFGVQKSEVKEVMKLLTIKNSESNYSKSKEKNVKLYSIDSILLIGYKLKKFKETKILIKSNRIIKNTYSNNTTILEIFKSKYSEIKNKFKILELI